MSAAPLRYPDLSEKGQPMPQPPQGYPPQQGYPPTQQCYPSPPGYPPQGGQYPPPQQGCPNPQQGYPPPQGGQYPSPQPYGQPYGPPPIQGQPPIVVIASSVGVQLGQDPCQTTCPHCRANVTTSVQHENGTLTWLLFGLLIMFCCVLGCCLIPFCAKGCKDVVHSCPSCHQIIGRYKRLGDQSGYRRPYHHRARWSTGRF